MTAATAVVLHGVNDVACVAHSCREEKPLTDRAKEEIKAVLAGADIDTPSGILKIVEVSGIAGDAAASIRKGRQLVFFEFTIETKWECECCVSLVQVAPAYNACTMAIAASFPSAFPFSPSSL